MNEKKNHERKISCAADTALNWMRANEKECGGEKSSES